MEPDDVVELGPPPTGAPMRAWTRRHTTVLIGVVAVVSAALTLTLVLPQGQKDPEVPGLTRQPTVAWKVDDPHGDIFPVRCGDGGVGLVSSGPSVRMECRRLTDGEVLWEREYPGLPRGWLVDLPGSPHVAVRDDESGRLALIDRRQGDVVTEIGYRGEVTDSAITGVWSTAGGRILVSTPSGAGGLGRTVRLLSGTGPGEVAWTTEVGPERAHEGLSYLGGVPVEEAGYLWMPTGDGGGGYALALNLDDGAVPDWSASNSRLFFVQGVVAATRSGLITRGHDMASGSTLWSWEAGDRVVASGEDAFYAASEASDVRVDPSTGRVDVEVEVSRVEPTTGRRMWTASIGHPVGLVRVVGDGVLVTDSNHSYPGMTTAGHVTLLDARTGKRRWSAESEADHLYEIAIGDGQVLALGTVSLAEDGAGGYGHSVIEAIDLRTGATRWSLTDAWLASGNGYVVSLDGGLLRVYR